jgi:hypothetical protein
VPFKYAEPGRARLRREDWRQFCYGSRQAACSTAIRKGRLAWRVWTTKFWSASTTTCAS